MKASLEMYNFSDCQQLSYTFGKYVPNKDGPFNNTNKNPSSIIYITRGATETRLTGNYFFTGDWNKKREVSLEIDVDAPELCPPSVSRYFL